MKLCLRTAAFLVLVSCTKTDLAQVGPTASSTGIATVDTTGTRTSSSTSSGAATSSSSTSTGTSTSGTTATRGSASSGGTSTLTTSSGGSASSGSSLPYQPYDAGPRQVVLPTGEALDAGCTVEAPYLLQGQCVNCRSTADCAQPLLCDVGQSFSCVNCLKDSQCPTNFACRFGSCALNCATDAGECNLAHGGFCAQGQCQASFGRCQSDTDCGPAAPFCDTLYSGKCGACPSDGGGGGCPSGQTCFIDKAASAAAPRCLADCRLDGGSCVPGICDADAGGGSVHCISACASNGDCTNPTPFCAGGHCVQCTGQGDCLAAGIGAPVCNAFGQCQPFCNGGNGSHLACGPLTCVDLSSGPTCVCRSDGDCAGQQHTPSCLAGPSAAFESPDAGFVGQCGCRPSDCGPGEVCETRPPVLPFGALTSACVPRCDRGQSCPSVFPNCNLATGFCVSCDDDAQCAGNTLNCPAPNVDPGGSCFVTTTPNCVRDPSASVPATGGGFCGCTSTASCVNGQVCRNPGQANSSCVEPCFLTPGTGLDSCANDTISQGSGFSPASTVGGSLCNTETGLCQQCFAAADCANFRSQASGLSQPYCTGAGVCSSCRTSADCPAGFPGCQVSHGECGTCDTSADCPPPGGGLTFTCLAQPNAPGLFPPNTCVASCAPDGGACAALPHTPFCSPVTGVCSQCRNNSDCPSGVGLIGVCTGGQCG